MMPSYFIAHGAPSLVLEDNAYTEFLNSFAKREPVPKAIVLSSAHWEDPVQQVSAAAGNYETIYDFYGFPDEMYQMTYPAPSEPALSGKIQALFAEHGIASSLDERRGLDHGAWAILKLMYPNADIPVVALSVNRQLTDRQQYDIGKALASLRDEGVMIIGSGGTVHNLRRVNWRSEAIDQWASEFDDWLKDKLESWDVEAMCSYREQAPYAEDCVPTSEHFIPLLLAMGSGDKNQKAELLFRGYQYGNLSLCCWQFS